MKLSSFSSFYIHFQEQPLYTLVIGSIGLAVQPCSQLRIYVKH